MMKKLLAWLMCLMMLCASCLAEESEEVKVYVNENAAFSFSYPASWQQEEAGVSAMGCAFSDYNEEFAFVMECTDLGVALSSDAFLSTYCPLLIDGYMAQYAGVEVTDAGSLYTAGDREYVLQTLHLEVAPGVPATMNLYYGLHGTCMYVIAFTVTDALQQNGDALVDVREAEQLVLSTVNYEAAVPAAEEAGMLESSEAEDVQQAGVYRNERGGYQFRYPDEMFVLSRDNVQSVLDSMTDENYAMEGMDPTALQQNAEQVRRMDMVMLMEESGLFNYNVVYQNAGISLTNELVLASLCPQFTAQYKAIYPDLVMVDEGTYYEAGGKQYVTQALTVNAAGIDMTMVILYSVNGTYLYNATFTAASAAMEDEGFLNFLNSAVELYASSLELFEPVAE